MLNIQRPVYLDPSEFAVNMVRGNSPDGLGDASASSDSRCSPITAGIIGAVLMYVIPPFLSGLINGARDELNERRR